MRYKLLLFIMLMCLSSYGQDFHWVRQIKGVLDDSDIANFIEVDNNGNTYTLGKTESTVYDIDPTQNGIQLIDNSNSLVSYPEDTFLIKLNADGNFIWGRSLSILKDDESVLGLKFDSQGYVYVLAYITELYQNTSLIHSYGAVNVIKFDPNGNEIYRHKIQNEGNINDGIVYAISSFDIDSSDNIYVTGGFKNTIIFDNNPQNNLVENGNSIYVLKMNQNGDILWTKNLNYKFSSEIYLNIDTNNEINLTFNCFDNANSSTLLKIIKLNNFNGNQIWAKSLENVSLYNADLDRNNNFVIVGMTGNNVDLNPDPNITNIVQNSSFILFLDSNGNYYDSKLFDPNISFYAIEIDNLNGYHFGGSFNSNVDFDPSSKDYYISSLGFANNGYYDDGFYLKLNSNRDFVQASIIGTPPLNKLETCFLTNVNSIKTFNENIYIVGDFRGNCNLDPTLTNYYQLNSINFNIENSDGFILKLGNCDILPPIGNINPLFCSSQNPTINNLTPNSSSINWYDSATSTIKLSNSTSLINDHTYYASKQIGDCPESQRLAVTVTINQTPTPPIVSNQTFCQSENALISNIIITGQNINWYDSLNAANLLSNSTILLNNTTYFATQTINNCESKRTPVTINITAEPLPTTSSPQTFCTQQNAILSSIAITGQNLKWYDALTNGNLLPNTTLLQDRITYYASQTINGCESDRIPIFINIQNTLAPTANANQSLCTSQNPTLNSISVIGTNLKWYDNSTLGNILPDTTPLQDGQTYYASQTVNNCESTARVAVSVSLISSLPAQNYAELFCDDLNDGTETMNLSRYNSSLISNDINYNFSYYTSLSSAQNETTSNKITNFSNYKLILGENKIYVRINSNSTCYTVAELKLTLLSKPKITIEDIVPICENKTIMIDAGVGFDSYLWSNGATTRTITISKPGDFSVTVTDNHSSISCSSTKNFTVKISNKASINSIDTKDWTDTENIITVFASGEGNYEYSIDGTNYQDSNVFTSLDSGKYIIQVRDKNGCGITKTDEVYLLMFPKFFTPNGDTYNDTWKIKLSDFEDGLTVNIYDRYGKLIKTLANNTSEWDGTYNGTELPSSDYWFVVTRANGKEHKGHFSLKR